MVSGVGLAVLMVVRTRLRGTTLVAPWAWSVVAVLSVGLTEVLIAAFGGARLGPVRWYLRYAAGVLSLCPGVALLGARRPQDRAWQVVVMTLVAILQLPALRSWILNPGLPLDLETGWRAFVLVLAAVVLVNLLPTRHGGAALVAFAGQMVLLVRQLPGGPSETDERGAILGLGLIVLAMVWASWPVRRREPTLGMQRVWRDFRDAYGAVWALRVVERFNTAEAARDRVRLDWSGLSRGGTLAGDGKPLSPEELRVAEQALGHLLWRFVSPEWIARRLPPDSPRVERIA